MLAINREALGRLKSPEVRALARSHWAHLLGTIGLHPVHDSSELPGRAVDERRPLHPRHPSHRQPSGHTAPHQGGQLGDGVNRSAAELASMPTSKARSCAGRETFAGGRGGATDL
jgi:hypothetical protein